MLYNIDIESVLCTVFYTYICVITMGNRLEDSTTSLTTVLSIRFTRNRTTYMVIRYLARPTLICILITLYSIRVK